MEFVLLTKVGMVVGLFIKLTYCAVGGVFVKTGIRYVKDYRESVKCERENTTQN
ncbi:hypothetical protein ACM26V_16945 [Salipaludibacillus sp. HK11]|uniref:hypothetical protein n=1 Tax=Salipaludibacillus sp. HK11 TaxID=3394320 RepID=UPI0039FD053F